MEACIVRDEHHHGQHCILPLVECCGTCFAVADITVQAFCPAGFPDNLNERLIACDGAFRRPTQS